MSKPSIWFMSRLQKSMFSILPISEDAAILRGHVSVVVFSTRVSDFGCGGCCYFEVHAVSSTELCVKMIVACSKKLIEIRSGTSSS